MKIRSLFLSSLIAIGAMGSSFAATDENSEMLQKLRGMYPATKIDSVRASGLVGVHEVVMGRNIAYTDDNGSLFLFGHIYDLKTQRDITAERLAVLDVVPMETIPLADAIKTVKGKGERRLFVFSDPDCPYCKRLEGELSKLDNVTIYTFMMPLDGLHPDARAKSNAVWCSSDRQKAWTELVLFGINPKSASCDTPVARNVALGQNLGINGTPTMLSAKGKRLSGAVTAEKISAWLDEQGAAK